MMLSWTGRDGTPFPVAGQTDEGRRAPWGCAAGAPYRGTASPPPPQVEVIDCTENLVYTSIPEAPMWSTAMDVFAMPEVTGEGEIYDCITLAVDWHIGYIVANLGKKSKKKDKKDKHGVGLQAKTVAQAMIRHWLTIFDVLAVICSDRGSHFVGSWFKSMCKHMEIRHAKTMAYLSRSNGRTELARGQLFENFRQTLRSQEATGTTSCGAYLEPSMTYRGLCGYLYIASCSCVMECHALCP